MGTDSGDRLRGRERRDRAPRLILDTRTRAERVPRFARSPGCLVLGPAEAG